MKTRIIILIIAFIFSNATNAISQDNIRISGYVRNYTGVLTGGDNELSILQNTLDLNFERRGSKVAFKVNPYLYHYFDSDLELGLREAYLDMYLGPFDFRIGKQQIIWGKAEGVFITDIVSPKDLREFLLPDFEEIRTGITAFTINYYFGNKTIEAVWSPVFTPTQMPPEGSIWRPEQNFPVEPEYDFSAKEITPSLENSDLFIRFSAMSSKIDYELVGGYFFYDDPAMHITRQTNPETQQLTGLIVRPEHHRVTMGGGSFSLPAGPLIIRGEGGYYSGRHFQTKNPAAKDALTEKDNLHYMAGIDYTLAGIRLSAQFIQEIILDYEPEILNEEFDNTMTFLARKDFFREKLWVELFSYIGFNNKDALIRPKVTWSFDDGFDILAGANIFTGNNGRFGQYDANDMVYLKIKYSF